MILNLSVARALAKAQLVISVDATRAANDTFKLPPYLLALVQSDQPALTADNVAAMDAEGERAGASATSRAALDTIAAALRAGYNGIGALLSKQLVPTGISDADRLEVHTTYGWAEGELGRFTDSRTLVLAELAMNADETIANPAWRYAPALVEVIEAQIAILEAEEPDAGTGGRQVLVDERTKQLDQLETHLSRVRYHYCSASDALDRSPELARIGFQPRRPRGAQKPAATGETPITTPVVTPVV